MNTIPSEGSDMAGKKADKTETRGRPKRKGTSLNMRLNPGLKEALDAYLVTVRPETTATAVIEMLLEDFLGSKGMWPPATE